MYLSDLLRNRPVLKHRGSLQVPISGISYNSRKVSPGDLFVCINGFRADGHQHIQEAVQRGAAALLVEQPPATSVTIPSRVPSTREELAYVCARFFGYPARKLRLVGVTGTNRKTTVTHMLSAIFSQAGYRTGIIGTVENRIPEVSMPATRTTPEAPELHPLLHKMVKAGVSHVFAEASSHGLHLHRLDACDFSGRHFHKLRSRPPPQASGAM